MNKNMFHQAITEKSINYIKTCEIHKLIVIYGRLKNSMRSISNHIWFNTSCVKKGVFPNYVHLKCNTKNVRSKKAVFNAKLIWVKEEIKFHYRTRDNISAHLKVVHSQLVKSLHPLEFDSVQQRCLEKSKQLAHAQYMRQLRKLKSLCARRRQPNRLRRDNRHSMSNTHDVDGPDGNTEFHPRVVNLTSTVFSQKENKLLQNGLNYAPDLAIRPQQVLDLAVHLEAALDQDCIKERYRCADIIKHQIPRLQTHRRTENKLVRSVREKLKKEDLILTKADKGNTITIMTKENYLEKMNTCISTLKVKEMKKDPTDAFNRAIINRINQSDLILDKKDRFLLKMSHPSAPILYGLPKIHKPGAPMRPVSSSCNAPAQLLSKKLAKLIPEVISFSPKYTVKNSIDLVEKIQHLNVPQNAKLVSFDVCNLFPSVPVKKLISLLECKICAAIKNAQKSAQLLNLVELCLSQNYFNFNDKFFIQEDGLAMGSSFSPFGADFFMDNLESRLFKKSCQLTNNIFAWFRYVDDIFCIWTGTERQLQLFLDNILNKMDDSIQFTLEIGNQTLNFLDLTIGLKNRKLSFEIYRKNTYSDALIPKNSTHPWSTKMAAFHSMLNRLLSLPLSPASFKKELGIIGRIAVGNGYEKSTVFRLLKRKIRKRNLATIFPEQRPDAKPKVWKKIPYIENVSNCFTTTLRGSNIEPAFFNNRTLKNILVNNKMTKNDNILEKSGIYKLKCLNCPGIYIGKTKRKLKTRLKEHISSARHTNPTSSFAQHLKDTKHRVDECNVELLRKIRDTKILDKYEIYEIRKAKQDGFYLLNDQLDFKNNSPLLCPNLCSFGAP